MTRETLIFLKEVLERVTISVNQPDWRQISTSVAKAQDELNAEIEGADAANTL